MVAAKKSQDPNSPYSQLMQNVTRGLEHIMKGGSSVDVVAKVVLKAVTTENPSLRHFRWKGHRNMYERKK